MLLLLFALACTKPSASTTTTCTPRDATEPTITAIVVREETLPAGPKSTMVYVSDPDRDLLGGLVEVESSTKDAASCTIGTDCSADEYDPTCPPEEITATLGIVCDVRVRVTDNHGRVAVRECPS